MIWSHEVLIPRNTKLDVSHESAGATDTTALESEFAWTALPIPNEAMAANAAKMSASTRPSFLFLRPRSSAYMAPPIMLPLWSLTRYLSAI